MIMGDKPGIAIAMLAPNNLGVVVEEQNNLH
jgi:hypothetical protein